MNLSPLLISVIVAGCFYAAGQYIATQPARIADHSITIQAIGSAKSTPTVAHVLLGVQIQPQPTSQQATDILAQQGNAVIDVVKKLNITEQDIATQNFSVQPSYDYRDGKQTLRGYEGSQQLDVIVRKMDQVGEVVAKATEAGANQIGGVLFKNDDPEVAQLSAEKDAIASARNKANELATSLGVRIGKVKSYTVQQNNDRPIPYAIEAKAMSGDVTVPQLPSGTQESMVTVTITYELR